MTFAGPALASLEDRTEYEAWLLEEAYRIADQPIPVMDVDELVYPPSGAPPTQTVCASVHIHLGDWRPGFLQAGAPLILVTAFKLIDMVLEWVLANNGHAPTYRFAQKIRALGGAVAFPPLIASRPWLQSRLVSLYAGLEPLRGTIIHNRQFTATDGSLTVENTRAAAPSTPVSITSNDLRLLSAFGVSLVHYLRGTWLLDSYRERWLRFWLDQLAHLHGEPLLGQLEPGFLNVRTYALRTPVIEVDLARIRTDVIAKRPGQDPLFDIRLVVVEADGSAAEAYVVPWATHEAATSPLRLTAVELAALVCPLPAGVDISAAARALAVITALR